MAGSPIRPKTRDDAGGFAGHAVSTIRFRPQSQCTTVGQFTRTVDVIRVVLIADEFHRGLFFFGQYLKFKLTRSFTVGERP